MRTNTKPKNARRTYEGGPARGFSPEQTLRRSLLSCMLWEKEFYEDGDTIADRIMSNARKLKNEKLAEIAVEARSEANIRHAPLLILLVMIERGGSEVGDTIARVIQRPDEITELLSLYWGAGNKTVTKQMRRGISMAFSKFDAYQLAKYNRDAPVKLRDAMFLSHAKPIAGMEDTFHKLAEGNLAPPDTWEVALSGGADKQETFTRLLQDGKLGYMALLRNLRNMRQAGVDRTLVKDALVARKGAGRVLPFRYVAAARQAPQFENALDDALIASLDDMEPLTGTTLVLVDVSASMNARLSSKSDMSRFDAAATLASIIPGDTRVFSFSNQVKEVPARKGMAGVDAINKSQPHMGTELGKAVDKINSIPHDRLIVITDEQSHDRVPAPEADKAYMINVASYQNGVRHGDWTRINGFSESVLRYIREYEKMVGA